MADWFRLIGGIDWLAMGGAVLAAALIPKTGKSKAIWLTIVLALCLAFPGRWAWENKQHLDAAREAKARYLEKIRQAEALFKEKCATTAGIKIYRTVPDVEGLLLLKVRPTRTDYELADPMWPGAAFGREDTGDSYIASFLGYEHPITADGSITPRRRGHINVDQRPGSLPGYRWIEVVDEKDGQRYRYTARYDEPWRTDSRYSKSYIRFNLDKSPAPKAMPRYGVTFEDYVIPEERALWLASGTIKVLDLKTNEVLAELTRYAMSYIHTPRHSMPWLNHSICPALSGGSGNATRHFVDQVLIPKKEN